MADVDKIIKQKHEYNCKIPIRGTTRKEKLRKKFGIKRCPNCGKEILKNALRCKYCKYSFKKYSNSNNKEKSS